MLCTATLSICWILTWSVLWQARWGARPDGICLVVGTCSRGFKSNSTGQPSLRICHLPLLHKADMYCRTSIRQRCIAGQAGQQKPACNRIVAPHRRPEIGQRFEVMLVHFGCSAAVAAVWKGHFSNPLHCRGRNLHTYPNTATSCGFARPATILGGIPSWEWARRPHHLYVYIH